MMRKIMFYVIWLSINHAAAVDISHCSNVWKATFLRFGKLSHSTGLRFRPSCIAPGIETLPSSKAFAKAKSPCRGRPTRTPSPCRLRAMSLVAPGRWHRLVLHLLEGVAGTILPGYTDRHRRRMPPFPLSAPEEPPRSCTRPLSRTTFCCTRTLRGD